ncbi:MAG: LpxL/LpxP family Kdo(2)-lipid IV(A) lauroyl/palmitoleoyl acyltransferase [Chromatiales bacterium]|jgi:KDO2-lipid IV(A) lauroyltransferase
MAKQQQEFSRELLHPKHWPLWLAFGIGWLVAQLPYRLQLLLGQLIGFILWHSSARRVHIARTNLLLCFPEKTAAEIETLLRKNFDSLGIGVIETSMSWWTPSRRLRKLVQIDGLEHLQAAHQHGKGVLLLCAHFSTLEIGGRLLSLFAPFQALYRQHKNPVFEYVMQRGRESNNVPAIERGDMRGMLRALKKNSAVWYAPDQNYGSEQSIFVKFFGVPASTITATNRLASMTGALVVPFFQRRLPGGQGYQLLLYPALDNFPSDSVEQDTQRINDLIEQQIRQIPEQYLWTHRRFKTRPDNLPPVY